MSAQLPAQNNSQIPGNDGSGEDEITIRTRLYYPLFGIAVIVGIILDVILLIILNTYVPGRARTPLWMFIIPIAVMLFLVSFIDDLLAKRFPNLVPEHLRQQLAAAEAAKAFGAPQPQGYTQMPGNPAQGGAAPQYQDGQIPQPGQYVQPAVQPTTPQSAGYGQAPGQAVGQQAAPGMPQQALYGQYGQPQQQDQAPQSGQYGQAQQPQYGQASTGQTPQNQQPYGQDGQPGQAGPVGY